MIIFGKVQPPHPFAERSFDVPVGCCVSVSSHLSHDSPLWCRTRPEPVHDQPYHGREKGWGCCKSLSCFPEALMETQLIASFLRLNTCHRLISWPVPHFQSHYATENSQFGCQINSWIPRKNQAARSKEGNVKTGTTKDPKRQTLPLMRRTKRRVADDNKETHADKRVALTPNGINIRPSQADEQCSAACWLRLSCCLLEAPALGRQFDAGTLC